MKKQIALKKPLFAQISSDGGLWSINFEADKPLMNQSITGYNKDTFKDYIGSKIPCVDFRTMNFSGWNFPFVKEHCPTNSNCIELKVYVNKAKLLGATITNL